MCEYTTHISLLCLQNLLIEQGKLYYQHDMKQVNYAEESEYDSSEPWDNNDTKTWQKISFERSLRTAFWRLTYYSFM